jgi:hypothetical protein
MDDTIRREGAQLRRALWPDNAACHGRIIVRFILRRHQIWIRVRQDHCIIPVERTAVLATCILDNADEHLAQLWGIPRKFFQTSENVTAFITARCEPFFRSLLNGRLFVNWSFRFWILHLDHSGSDIIFLDFPPFRNISSRGRFGQIEHGAAIIHCIYPDYQS